MGERKECPTKERVNGWVSIQDFALQLEFLGSLSNCPRHYFSTSYLKYAPVASSSRTFLGMLICRIYYAIELFVLWLDQKTRIALSTNEVRNLSQPFGTHVFPASNFFSFFLKLLLAVCEIFLFSDWKLWLLWFWCILIMTGHDLWWLLVNWSRLIQSS